MNNWFVKNLGDAMLVAESLDHLKTLFLSEYQRTQHAEEMAVFMRHESDGRLHCELKVYFAPAANAVAKEVGASPCNRPDCGGLSLLAGSNASWSILFPERDA